MRKRWPIALAAAGAAAAGAVVAGAAASARMLRVDEHELRSPRLPEAFDGTRLVFASDIHAGFAFTRRRMERLVDRVNALRPDILVLGGDYVGGKNGGDRVFYPAAARFSAPLGCFGVLGNHDADEGAELARAGFAEAGMTLLENAASPVEKDGERIWVAGIEDEWTGAPDVAVAAREIPAAAFAVLVAHNPDAFATALPYTCECWDLALAGHTHGGQVVLARRVTFTRPSRYGLRYRSGWRTEEGVPILVSNGVGTTTAPLRFAARAEVHVITLRRG